MISYVAVHFREIWICSLTEEVTVLILKQICVFTTAMDDDNKQEISASLEHPFRVHTSWCLVSLVQYHFQISNCKGQCAENGFSQSWCSYREFTVAEYGGKPCNLTRLTESLVLPTKNKTNSTLKCRIAILLRGRSQIPYWTTATDKPREWKYIDRSQGVAWIAASNVETVELNRFYKDAGPCQLRV